MQVKPANTGELIQYKGVSGWAEGGPGRTMRTGCVIGPIDR